MVLSIVTVGLLTLGGCGPADRPPDARATPSAEPLRVITPLEPVPFRPREAAAVGAELEIIDGFARELGRPLERVPEDDAAVRIERLLAGEAELLAASLTVTDARREVLRFAEPHLYTDELLVAGRDEDVDRLADVAGWTVCVRAGSSYAESLDALEADGLELDVVQLPTNRSTEAALEAVADGRCRATVADRYLWNAVAAGFPGLRAAAVVAEDRPIAIAVRPDLAGLQRRLTEHLTARALTGSREHTYTDDLPGLKRRGRLRMLTRNTAANYFLHRGRQYGFEYELLRRFADEHGLVLEVAVPPDHELLERWLLEGRGDVIAAQWTITDDRRRRVRFTRPHLRVDQVVAVREDEAGVVDPTDLTGRKPMMAFR